MTKAIPEERTHVPAASREVQLALARQAEARGDEAAAITHLAAACALGGTAADWLALGERVDGDAAIGALAQALEVLDGATDLRSTAIMRAQARRRLRSGDLDTVRQLIRHLVTQTPRDVETMLVAAESAAALGEPSPKRSSTSTPRSRSSTGGIASAPRGPIC